MAPVADGHLLCIAVLPPGQSDVPPAFVAQGGAACGRVLLAAMGL